MLFDTKPMMDSGCLIDHGLELISFVINSTVASSSKFCSYGEDTLCLLRQSASELAYNGSDTSGLENPLGWMGQALRFAPLLSAYTRKARGGPIQTIAPAFDGLKVFPSLAGLSIARFGLCSFQACQPAGASAHRVSALAPQSGGLRRIIDAEMSKYLSKSTPPK
jgi:hypothetical protein